ncbi:MAG: Tim44 domain-containing protein [Alphaproteobacteria bacterium]|nr:Tim44 domain-containing protein [Alphaproteobacteria bacterium]
MPADLIVYALVAAGLIFWLRSVLGTRHGEERDRPNPLMAAAEKKPIPGAAVISEAKTAMTMEQKIADLVENPREKGTIDNKTAEMGLIEIARMDNSFDIDFFLQGAQDAFIMVVESFAEGDRETLEALLAEPVYQAFDGALRDRAARGETQITDIHALRKVEITAARIEDRRAMITVRFTADETSLTRDAQGNILHGHPDKITQMKDLWTFGRALRSKDPSWLVYETRGDVEDDNETLPNTH